MYWTLQVTTEFKYDNNMFETKSNTLFCKFSSFIVTLTPICCRPYIIAWCFDLILYMGKVDTIVNFIYSIVYLFIFIYLN